MIWQNSAAFLGLVALALPVVIHLWSRKRAVVQKFPSLRFLDVTRLLPTRTLKVSDVPLLLVRLAILAAAVLALAQPLWVSAGRQHAFNAALARAIIVDTSGSMLRTDSSGARARDRAAQVAERLAADARTSAIMQTAAPAGALAGAVAWLETQAGRGEVVILSDFQLSAVDSGAIAAIPGQYGVHLERMSGTFALSDSASSFRTTAALVRVTPDSAGTRAEWSALPAAVDSDRAIVLLTAARDRASVEAARQAAEQTAASLPSDSTHSVAIVYPGADTRAAFVAGAKSPTQRWMAHVMTAISRSELVTSTARAADGVADTTIGAPFTVLAQTRAGHPLLFAAEGAVAGREGLVLFVRAAAGSVTSAAVIAAASRALSVDAPVSEWEPRTLSDAALAALQRVPQEVEPNGASNTAGRTAAAYGTSDGRWLWLLALLLLLLETYLRRSRPVMAAPDVEVRAAA